MAAELFRVHNQVHQDLPNILAQMAKSFVIGKFVKQLYNQSHNPIFYVGVGPKFWTITLDFLYKFLWKTTVNFISMRHQMDHVRWDELKKY